MEVVSICLYIVFCTLILLNFHKAILILGPMFILCQPYMCLRYNSPAISLVFITQFTILLFFFFKQKKLKLNSFPLSKPLYFLFLILIIGFIISPQNPIKIAPWLLSYVISYLFVVIYYNELNSLSDAKLSLKAFLFTAIILLSYFVFEFYTQSNPFIQFLHDLLGHEKSWVFPIGERFGMIRCQSLMCISISWGALCSFILAFVLLIKRYKLFRKKNIYLACMAIIAIAGVYCSGSRSAYLFLFAIICAFLLDLEKGKRIFLYIVIFIISLFLLSSFVAFLDEIFGDNVEGSNLSMRQMQYTAIINTMQNSLIFGLGIKGYELALKVDADILGAESIWFQTIINHGLMGVIMQIFMYISCWKFIKKYGSGSVICKFMLLGWIIFNSVTTSPGLSETYFLTILILFVKTISFLSQKIKIEKR